MCHIGCIRMRSMRHNRLCSRRRACPMDATTLKMAYVPKIQWSIVPSSDTDIWPPDSAKRLSLRSAELLSFALLRATFVCAPQSDFPLHSAERLSRALRGATFPCAPQSDLPLRSPERLSLVPFQIQTFMVVLCAPHPRFSDQFGKEQPTSFEQTRYR